LRCCAARFAAVSPVGRVVFDQPMSVLPQEIDSPRGCNGCASEEDGPDILEVEAWVFWLAAWHRMAAFVVDRELKSATEAVLAVMMIIALRVLQRVQLRVRVSACHAFRHGGCVGGV
jgi:hypothetical protein